MTQLAIDVDGEQMDRMLAIVAGQPDFFHREFADWLRENFAIWVRFESEANRLRRQGRKHYSAYTIVEYLRHQTTLAQAGGDLKINGNVVASLARLYVAAHPMAFGFFEFRTMKNKGTPLGVCAA